jgi:hypothetical protein
MLSPLILDLEIDSGGHAPAHVGQGVGEQDGDFVDDVTLVLGEGLPDREDLAAQFFLRERIQGHRHRLPLREVDHVDLGQVGGLHQPLTEICHSHGGLPGIDRAAQLGIQICHRSIERRNHREGGHACFGGFQACFQHRQLLGIRTAFETIIGALGRIQLGLLEGQIVLGFDDPILRRRTLDVLGLGTILIAAPGLYQVGAVFGLGNLVGIVEIIQVIDGIVVFFLGILQIDDSLGKIGAGSGR